MNLVSLDKFRQMTTFITHILLDMLVILRLKFTCYIYIMGFWNSHDEKEFFDQFIRTFMNLFHQRSLLM